jgi:hypothetical protein
MRIPDRACKHEPAPGKERRGNLEHFPVIRSGQVIVPEGLEHLFERSVKLSRVYERGQKIVDAEAGGVIRRFSPFSARAVEESEVRAVPEQDVIGVEIFREPGKAGECAA